MTIKPVSLYVSAATLLVFADVHAAGSLLRVACEGADVGAEVFVNGKFRGECPVDIQVSEGMLTLRVVKKVDADRERSFEQQTRIGDGTIKKLDVVLSALQFTAEGLKREREREAARQAAAAEQRALDEAAFQRERAAAEAGDAAAMLALADRYAAGRGVAKSDPEAVAWLRKAARLGSAVAAFKLSDMYRTGNKQDVSEVIRMLSFPVGEERIVSAEGEAAIRALVAADPFFEVAGGSAKLAYADEVTRSAAQDPVRAGHECRRRGRSAGGSGHVVHAVEHRTLRLKPTRTDAHRTADRSTFSADAREAVRHRV